MVKSRRERFICWGVSRTRKATKALRLVARMGDRKFYDYTMVEAKKIIDFLDAEMADLRKAFYRKSSCSWQR